MIIDLIGNIQQVFFKNNLNKKMQKMKAMDQCNNFSNTNDRTIRRTDYICLNMDIRYLCLTCQSRNSISDT